MIRLATFFLLMALITGWAGFTGDLSATTGGLESMRIMCVMLSVMFMVTVLLGALRRGPGDQGILCGLGLHDWDGQIDGSNYPAPKCRACGTWHHRDMYNCDAYDAEHGRKPPVKPEPAAAAPPKFRAGSLSYHDVLVFAGENRFYLSDAHFGIQLQCDRMGGWQLWDLIANDRKGELLASEYDDNNPLCVEVMGAAVIGARPSTWVDRVPGKPGWGGRVQNSTG